MGVKNNRSITSYYIDNEDLVHEGEKKQNSRGKQSAIHRIPDTWDR